MEQEGIAMTNLGLLDRIVRFAAGTVLIALCLLPSASPVLGGFGAWTWVTMAAGAILIATAALRFCPAYRLLGMNTCGRD
jgi:hypothetical protein